jgi:hypothetical protein
MPVTAALFLVGALSISALPPFNGFVSEWLLFQAVLTGPQFPRAIAALHVARRRRHAGAGRGAGGGMLRARLRHRLPGPATFGRGGQCP